MVINLTRYLGKYVHLTLSCGTPLYGKLEFDTHDSRSLLLKEACVANTAINIFYIYLDDVVKTKRGRESGLRTYEISQEHITFIEDISGAVEARLKDKLPILPKTHIVS